MAYKNDYSVVVFFLAGNTKKWTFVHNLRSFANFLDKSHTSWVYMNVYSRREGKYLRRYYPANQIPKFL